MDELQTENRRLADSGEPVYALSEALARRAPEQQARLRELAGGAAPEYWLTRPETLEMLLLALPAADYSLFVRAAEQPFLQAGELPLSHHIGLLELCLLQAYWVQDALYLVVPGELRALWRELKQTGLPQRKQYRDTVDAYAQAAARLYGALPLPELERLLREQGGLSAADGISALLEQLADGSLYHLEDGLLLAPGLTAAAAQPYLRAAAAYPRYQPAHEKLLYLGEGGYYDVFPALEQWRLELEAVFQTREEAEPAALAELCCDRLYAILQAELCDRSHAAFFAPLGLAPDEERVQALKRQVRLWCLGGNTPAALEAAWRQGRLKPPVNAPCFCGSGRKFKRCHGAVAPR